MKFGKVSESIFNRTVYKTIQTYGYHDTGKASSASLGADCAILASSKKYTVTATGTATGKDANLVARAMIDACNKIAASGINLYQKDNVTIEISFVIMMSQDIREAKLREMLEIASGVSCEFGVEIVTVHSQVAPGMDHQVTVSAFAVAHTDVKPCTFQNAKPNQDIVMTKWMAMEGTSIIATRKQDELATRYPLSLIEDAANFNQYLSIIPEAATAVKSDVSAMQVVRHGGIFGGLWKLAQGSGVGLVVDLKKIAVKQETIEICDFFDINPYKLISGGNLLLTTDKGAHLVGELEMVGIPATIIGKTTEGNDRVITNEEETRYLEPAREDEIYSI